MNVKQLIAKLEKLPPKYRVIMVTSSGADSNASPLDTVQSGYYREENTWSGNVKHPDDVEDDECVVELWPVN